MINNTLSIIANIHAHNNIITPSTTIIIVTNMVNVSIPSIVIHIGIQGCRTVATIITIPAVVIITNISMIAIYTIFIIITSTRLLLLVLLP